MWIRNELARLINIIMTITACIAKIDAKPEHREKVLFELSKIIAPTRQENGCISYDMYIDNSNSCVFMFYENWASEKDLDRHMESSHVSQCFEIIDDMLDSVEVTKLTKFET